MECAKQPSTLQHYAHQLLGSFSHSVVLEYSLKLQMTNHVVKCVTSLIRNIIHTCTSIELTKMTVVSVPSFWTCRYNHLWGCFEKTTYTTPQSRILAIFMSFICFPSVVLTQQCRNYTFRLTLSKKSICGPLDIAFYQPGRSVCPASTKIALCPCVSVVCLSAIITYAKSRHSVTMPL